MTGEQWFWILSMCANQCVNMCVCVYTSIGYLDMCVFVCLYVNMCVCVYTSIGYMCVFVCLYVNMLFTPAHFA